MEDSPKQQLHHVFCGFCQGKSQKASHFFKVLIVLFRKSDRINLKKNTGNFWMGTYN